MEKKRRQDIDILRGLALLMMVFYHLLFDLSFFGNYDIPVLTGFWKFFARSTAILFITTAGISLSLAAKEKPFKQILQRITIILFAALGISVTTFLFFKEQFIFFGILHLIGVSLLITYPFHNKPKLSLLLSFFSLLLGFYLSTTTISSSSFLWIGLRSEQFQTLDYFPLFPWISFLFLGIFLGNKIYKKKSFIQKENIITKPFSFLGKHTLTIYLIHQPLLILLLSLLGIISFPF